MDDSLREAVLKHLKSKPQSTPYVSPPEEVFENIETKQQFTVPNPADRERIKKMKNVTIASGRSRRRGRGRTRGRSRSALKRRKVI